MSSSIDLEKLAAEESHYLKTFDAKVAFELGLKAKEISESEFPGRSVVIDITLASGPTIFRTAIGGITPDNEEWIKMKRNTVLRFGSSSYRFGKRFESLGRTLKSRDLDPTVYTTYGGGFPIYVAAAQQTIIAVITISGLKDHEDHYVAAKAVELISKE